MVSPVPKYLRTASEERRVPCRFRDHVTDLDVPAMPSLVPKGGPLHRARFQNGLSSQLIRLADTPSVGDPMAGTGSLVWDTQIRDAAVNDLDKRMAWHLDPLVERYGAEVSFESADRVTWQRDACVFSPPYYPRTDRKRPNAHDDAKRGPVVGFRDSYGIEHPDFIGQPAGVNGIRIYRDAMTLIYAHLLSVCSRMVIVTKNWMRLGTELRLDIDTILMAMACGWRITARHGWLPNPSLWARFNERRGGMVMVEDILIFDAPSTQLGR